MTTRCADTIDLAKRHNLSAGCVWNILKRQRGLHINRVQMDLFDGEDAAHA